MKKNGSGSVAIVGTAFRFPGGLNDEISFWQALQEGRDAVSQISDGRWATDLLQHPKRSEPGRSITFSAGVLSKLDEFDADFFGVSPREASWLDPQQRLLLELTWEAMENGGILPSSMAGSDCAVYVGISGVDYGMHSMDDLASMSAYSMTGNTLSIAANRLSYFFDLRGPSVAVDTACSSSLVALHQACSSLRTGESTMALVGGVNLLLHPYPFIGFTKASMLSSNGRCRAFDASGDGYVRAEGGAVLLLKPLDRALADGDDIQAVILATGVNADGSRKTGITIPSGEGQAELMRAVLKRSGHLPSDIDYIEAHGTGTAVGDPIEAAAIGEVYGRSRPQGQVLPIGSVKTNLGHLESASGMAGLIKAIQVLKHRAVPASLHLETLNPRIDFSELNLEVVTQLRQLPRKGRKKFVVGVNSFGFGGANAHVLLQEFRPSRTALQASCVPPPIFLSARNPQALRDLAGRYAEQLRQQPQFHYDIAYSAALHRERMEARLAIATSDVIELADLLSAYSRGETVPQVVTETAPSKPGGVAFVFSGNGAQWLGMGRQLLAESSRFAELIAGLDASIHSFSGFSILEEFLADAATSRLSDTSIAQPLLFAMQVALTTMLRERGVIAQAVVGHSLGEVAAAWAAGALSLDQAIEVICMRSTAQALTWGNGRMAAVGLSEESIRALITGEHLDEIEIAGINSPNNVTLSGRLNQLERLEQILAPRGVFFRMLPFEYGFHSHFMDPIEADLETRLKSIKPGPANNATFVSTVTGDVLEGASLDVHYWWRNVRQPVRFAEAISTLVTLGCRVFIEIGPHAILQRYTSECLTAQDISGRVLPTLRRDDDGLSRLQEAVLRAHLLVKTPGLRVFFPESGRRIRLPNYPWQRERHWRPQTSEGYRLVQRRLVHPLLGWRLKETAAAWENVLDPALSPWLADHKVANAVVLPGSAYVEMALAAAREHFGGECLEIEELDIVAPIVFDGEHARSIRFELSIRDGSFQIRSRQRLSEDEWMLNAAGRLLGSPTQEKPAYSTANNSKEAADVKIVVDRDLHYRLAAALGLDYGPSFQGLARATVCGQTLYGELVIPPNVEAGASQYLIHPVLLDSCFQSLVGFFKFEIEAGQGLPLLPVKLGRLQRFSDAPITHFRAALKHHGARSVQADFELLDQAGHTVALLIGCRFRAATVKRREQPEAACWKIVPRLKPLKSEQLISSLPSAGELVQRLQRWFSQSEPVLKRANYFKEELPLFEALALAFGQEAFQHAFVRRSEWLQQAIETPAIVQEDFHPFFIWMTRLLQQEGLLAKGPEGWRVESADLPPAETIWRTLLHDYSDSLPELMPLGRVGRHLAAMLVDEGDVSGLNEGLRRSPLMESLFEDTPAYQGTRLAVQEILRTVAEGWPVQRRLRVLEVRTAPGELSRPLIESLPLERLDYVIAHADDETYARLQAEHAGSASVVVAKLGGVGLEITADGELPESFDVVVFRHALHAMSSPNAAMAAVKRRLARGGLLILAERHPDLHADFAAGANSKWWRAHPGGVSSCLMSPKAWEKGLAGEGFSEIHLFREPASESLAEGAYLLMAKRPEEDALPMAAPVVANWLLVCDATDLSLQLADKLRRLLESRGQYVRLVKVDSKDEQGGLPMFVQGDPASAEALLAAASATMVRVDHVVYLAGALDEAWMTGTSPNQLDLDGAIGLFHLVHAMGQTPRPPRLWVVTMGGALAGEIPGCRLCNPLHGALWGFGRVVMNEYPALDCTLIDLQIAPSNSDAANLLHAEMLQPDGEKEIVLSSQGRHVLRMERVLPTEKQEASPHFRLDFRSPGQLRNLVWLQEAERALDDEEIEVRVAATGLNFRDVMYLMGLLPDEAVENGFAGASLGLEFSGVVSRVGQRVREFVVGDAVMGFGSACFASHVVTQANAITLKPEDWSFEAAATVPTVFFTVYYALKHLADLQSGERVLIHGAAGGVGIAAVQLARFLGAEVFATAGSNEKRDFVKLLGADHVFDSRSLAFAEEILALTGGEGVDVVLNSLAGEAIRRNLRILKPFGRFLELGKRDFFENTPVGLRPFKDNISYFGIDADQLLIARPALAARLFREVMALFRDGVLFPLPHRVFLADRVVDAFRTMQQARQIGKVVVKLDGARISVESAPPVASAVHFEKDKTWLVTGGLSGFGLESARWLVECGARHLVLVGRRGMATPSAAEVVRELESLGARIKVVACDISDRTGVQSMLADIRRNCPPLSGILHCAMVLDDALIANLDADRMRKVLAPKLLGAWNLHSLTLDIPLEHFILYSSVTTFIGNPGQASYVAANASLESLAALRRAIGLQATCIGWGPIGDAGYLTRNQAVKDSLTARLGAAPLRAKDALTMLDRLIVQDSVIAVADFDWPTLARLLPSAQGPRFETLRRQMGTARNTDTEGDSIHSLVAGKTPEETRIIIQSLVTHEIAQVLCVGADRIDPARSLHDMGMDSLMGVELALGLEKRFGIQLPAMMLNEGPTVDRVSARITERILGANDQSEVIAGDGVDAVVAALAAQHGENISADELAETAEQIRKQGSTGLRLGL